MTRKMSLIHRPGSGRRSPTRLILKLYIFQKWKLQVSRRGVRASKMLSMAIQPTVDASSLKPLPFRCASVSPKPSVRAFVPAASSCSLSGSHGSLSCHRRGSRRELRISAPVAAVADAMVSDEESADEVPPETEVRRASLHCLLPTFSCLRTSSLCGS